MQNIIFNPYKIRFKYIVNFIIVFFLLSFFILSLFVDYKLNFFRVFFSLIFLLSIFSYLIYWLLIGYALVIECDVNKKIIKLYYKYSFLKKELTIYLDDIEFVKIKRGGLKFTHLISFKLKNNKIYSKKISGTIDELEIDEMLLIINYFKENNVKCIIYGQGDFWKSESN